MVIGKGYITVAALSDGAQGPQGEQGAAGIDGVTVTASPSSIVLKAKKTGEATFVADTSGGNTAQLSVMRGGTDITGACAYGIKEVSGCRATVTTGGLVRVTGVALQNVDGATVPVTSGSVTVAIRRADGVTMSLTIGVNVDVSAVWGGLETSADGLKSEFTELKNDLSGDDPTTLQRYTSKIEQSARKISLEVSANTLKKDNLLGGTAFRRMDAALWAESLSGAVRLRCGGYGGMNYARMAYTSDGSTSRWLGVKWGDAEKADVSLCPNVKVGKGRHTLSVMARCSVAGQQVGAAEVYTGSGPYDRQGAMTSLFSRTFAVDAADTWELKTFDVEVAEDCYLYVGLYLHSFVKDTEVRLDLCQPCLVEGDFYSWRESTLDCGYIGGNLLDGARSLSVGGNLSLVEGTVETGADGLCSVTRTTDTAIGEVLEWKLDGKLELGTDYTFSFWAKGSGTVATYMYHGSDGISIDAEGSNGASVTGWGDGNINFALTGVWTRCWVHWRNNGTGQADRVLLRAQPGTTVTAMKPKLEVGAAATEWTDNPQTYVEEGSLAQRLYATGINITDGSIDMTADKFTLRNNKGERSFDVDAEGNLEARSLRSVNADGSLVVTVADGVLRATAADNGASVTIGLEGGLPVLQFTDTAGRVCYQIGLNGGRQTGTLGFVLKAVGVTYSVSDSLSGDTWTVQYGGTVTLRNVSAETLTVYSGDVVMEVDGFGGKKISRSGTVKGVTDASSGKTFASVLPNMELEVSFGTSLGSFAETLKKKNADGSYNSYPSGKRPCTVSWNGTEVGSGEVTG